MIEVSAFYFHLISNCFEILEWNTGRRNIKLDQAEFIDTGPPSGNLSLIWKLTQSEKLSNIFVWLIENIALR